MTDNLTTPPSKVDEPVRRSLRLLRGLFAGLPMRRVGIRLWDGTLWPDDGPRRATIVLNHPGALRAMLLPATEVALAEAYLYDDFDVVGDIEAVFEFGEHLIQRRLGVTRNVRVARDLLCLPGGNKRRRAQRGPANLKGRRHSAERDRKAVTYHYDVPGDFYALWLDPRMVYSCAYFDSPDDDLETAQARKLDYLCRKLRLRAGQRLLDIGCGWGALVAHAAEHFGVEAVGITLSGPQADLANERLKAAGLEGRARVLVRDYREMEDSAGVYDAIVSVGMFEHVGAAMLPTYFARAWRLLRPGGVFLNHGIASAAQKEPRRRRSFTQSYVFPDGELLPVSTPLRIAEESGFEVRDVESLREHYALTLRHWVRRLETHHAQALQIVDEPTYRVWRLFMSGSAHGFRVGRLNVYQSLLIRPGPRGSSGLPLTRADWYQ